MKKKFLKSLTLMFVAIIIVSSMGSVSAHAATGTRKVYNEYISYFLNIPPLKPTSTIITFYDENGNQIKEPQKWSISSKGTHTNEYIPYLGVDINGYATLQTDTIDYEN